MSKSEENEIEDDIPESKVVIVGETGNNIYIYIYYKHSCRQNMFNNKIYSPRISRKYCINFRKFIFSKS